MAGFAGAGLGTSMGTCRLTMRCLGLALTNRRHMTGNSKIVTQPKTETTVIPRKGPRPVHICGFGSSGTDLLSLFMSAHPDIHTRGEFPMLPRLARKYGAVVARDQVDEVVRAIRSGDVYKNLINPYPVFTDDDFTDGVIAFSDIFAAMLTDRDVEWCGNKTPQNTENIGKLLKLFPDMKAVFTARDIRDVCLSWRDKWGKNMYLCAAKWNWRMARGLAILDSLPADQTLQLRFETLIADPGSVGEWISEFLDLPYNEAFLNYHQTVNANPDGKKNFGKPMDAANREKWRRELTTAQIRRIEEIAYPMMIRLGYKPEFAQGHRKITIFEIVWGLAADLYAAFAVSNRYRRKNRLSDRLRKLSISVRYRLPSV